VAELGDRVMSTVIARGLGLPPARTHDVVREDDVPIPMDDGVWLLADIYTPAGSAAVPTVLVRSPYGRKGVFGALQGRVLAERGFRSVLQSCRGTYGSGGTFEIALAERADGLATIRWIEAQPWFDGRLGMLGPSYLGYAQWVVAAQAGSSLRAICPHTTTAHLPGHWYDSGSLTLDDAINWSTLTATQEAQRWPLLGMLTNRWPRRVARVVDRLPVEDLDKAVLDRRDARWRSIVEHADDSYWQAADATNDVARVTVPVNVVTGWYDLFLPKQLAEYRMLVDAGSPPRMTIGPWTHAQREMAACSMRESISWLTAHLEADGADSTTPEARVRVEIMGSGEWRDFATWPPDGYEAQRWHLHPGRRLSPETPGASEPSHYTYDPADPTPVRGGAILDVRRGGRHDQRAVEERRDVLCFTSAVLASDVEIVGDVTADVHVASDVASFDVCVRVCEVDERGRSRNVTDGLVRVPADDGGSPERVQVVQLQLWPTAYRFRKGRRIRVQVASGAFPRYARNLGTDEPIASGTTMRRAHLAVHHSPEHPSAVVLPVSVAA
jgi:putative CocE/NonD family hydrolase